VGENERRSRAVAGHGVGLWATSLTICAAWFSKMSFRSISCAMVTPSVVIVGESNALCKTTY